MRALTYPRHLARQAVLLLTVSYLTGCASPAPVTPSTRCAQVNYRVRPSRTGQPGVSRSTVLWITTPWHLWLAVTVTCQIFPTGCA